MDKRFRELLAPARDTGDGTRATWQLRLFCSCYSSLASPSSMLSAPPSCLSSQQAVQETRTGDKIELC